VPLHNRVNGAFIAQTHRNVARSRTFSRDGMKNYITVVYCALQMHVPKPIDDFLADHTLDWNMFFPQAGRAYFKPFVGIYAGKVCQSIRP